MAGLSTSRQLVSTACAPVPCEDSGSHRPDSQVDGWCLVPGGWLCWHRLPRRSLLPSVARPCRRHLHRPPWRDTARWSSMARASTYAMTGKRSPVRLLHGTLRRSDGRWQPRGIRQVRGAAHLAATTPRTGMMIPPNVSDFTTRRSPAWVNAAGLQLADDERPADGLREAVAARAQDNLARLAIVSQALSKAAVIVLWRRANQRVNANDRASPRTHQCAALQ